VIPFAKIEWATCTGDDAVQSVLLIKAASRARPHGLIFATNEQRDMVTARLSEWNVQQAPIVQERWWSSGSSDNAAPTMMVAPVSGVDWAVGGEPWTTCSAPMSELAAREHAHAGRHAKNDSSTNSSSGHGGNAWHSSDGETDAGDMASVCCVHLRESGACVCQLGCCQMKLSGGGKGLLARLERFFVGLVELLRRRSLEIFIFGLLMPLAFSTMLHLWSLKEHKTYDRPWLEAECKILELEVQSHRLYMHGDYLRNSHPNDGVYYVLQPAWRSLVTPLPPESFYTRDRVSCCRQSHAQAHLPSSIEHVQRTPREPWLGLTFDEVSPGASARCKGNVAVSLQETMDICKRSLHWTLPTKFVINTTYPCWYAAHGATHVYLHVEPPVVRLASADILAIVLLLMAIASLAALVLSHPVIQQRLLLCCRRDQHARAAAHGDVDKGAHFATSASVPRHRSAVPNNVGLENPNHLPIKATRRRSSPPGTPIGGWESLATMGAPSAPPRELL